VRIIVASPEETLAVGETAGRSALPGLLITLQGGLGAGKTLFTKGVAKGLGVASWKYVTSPTFAIHNTYAGRLPLHHFDLYRLQDKWALEDLGFEEILFGGGDAPGVCAIEWPELFFELFPEDRMDVKFHWDENAADSEQRTIEISAAGKAAETAISEIIRIHGRIHGHSTETKN